MIHGGVKSTLTELRSRFWIVQGRQFVRKLLYECVVSRRLEGRPHVAPPPPSPPAFVHLLMSELTLSGPSM